MHKGDWPMKYLLVIAILGCSLSCFGQESAQYRACNDTANTQDEMHRCASDEAGRVNAQLNAVYAKLLSTLAGHRLALEKVKAAEKAWITYRDAYIEAMYPAKDKQAAYGTIYPMEVDLLSAQLTQKQIGELSALQKHFEADGPYN
jgi:uncharacterized protein YecT (DUF1311 family)